jgi:hypothetical protein
VNGDVAMAGMTMQRYAIQTMAMDSCFRGNDDALDGWPECRHSRFRRNDDVAKAGMAMAWTGGPNAVIPAKAESPARVPVSV